MDHAIALMCSGWLEAGQFWPGDRLRTASGAVIVVVGVRQGVGYAPVYTLTVAKDHTFFVGAARVLVHNAGGKCNNDIGQAAEAYVRYITGGKKATLYVTMAGQRIPRFVDVLAEDGTDYEVKAGEYSVRSLTRKQVEKDVELVRSGQVKEVVWVFFRSPIDLKICPTPALRSLLQDNNIKVLLIEDPDVANLRTFSNHMAGSEIRGRLCGIRG